MTKPMLADVSEKRRAEAEEVLRQNGIEDAKVKSVLQKVGLALSGKDLYEQEAENTAMEYLYRDASNYKTWNYIVLEGQISQEQKEIIRNKLYMGDMFIPKQVGLPLIRGWDFSNDDHCWAEIDVDTAFSTTNKAPDNGSVEKLIEKFAAVDAWNDY